MLRRGARPAALAAFTLVLTCTADADALTIVGEFVGGRPLGPSVGGGDIVDIFRAAADTWERAIQDDFTVTFEFGWGPGPGGTHELLAQGGTPNRETHGRILVNAQVASDGGFMPLFLDPTPSLLEEFPIYHERAEDLGAGALNVERRYSAPIGPGAALFQDLLSILLHEIGHGLGLSVTNRSFVWESADGHIDVTAPLPFAGSVIPLAFNNHGVTSHVDPAIVGPVMGSLGFNDRRLPTAADILANAQISGFREVNLDLVEVSQPPPLALVLAGLAAAALGLGRSRRGP
jgi:hypothetical protein